MASDFHAELRTTTRHALAALGVPSYDDPTIAHWNRLVGPLGLAGLLIDPQDGGLGLGLSELALVSEEIGRAIPSSPFLPTSALAASWLSACDTAGAKQLLVDIAAGTIDCLVAGLDEHDATASPHGDHVTLTGRAPCAIGSPGYDPTTVVLVCAGTPDGVALFVAEASAVLITPADMLDPTRGLYDLEFRDAPAHLVGTPAASERARQAAYRTGLVAVSAEQIGIARACLDAAVEHAKTREQFGSPIGSFQAIKHRCTEMLFRIEMAAAALEAAILDEDDCSAMELAFLTSSDAAIFAAESAIHVHGGTGFTWEHPAHRYLRRARVNSQLFGSAARHREAIAAAAGV